LSASFDDLVKLNDVGVPDNFQNLNFTHHPSDVSLLFDFVFLEDFDRHLFLGDLVNAQPDLAKSTLTDGFA